MQIKNLNWRSNSSEFGSFYQMIGELPFCKIKYFITKMKYDQKYTIKIIDNNIPTFYIEDLDEAKEFCQQHFNNWIKSNLNDTI